MSPARLNQSELAELAQDWIEPKLYQTERQERPTAILLAGQSGAGKSTVSNDLRQALQQRGGYIAVDADHFRHHLPYVEDLDRGDMDFSAQTQVDAGALANAIRDEAIKNRRNLVIDGTLRDSDAAIELAKSLRENGYRVELHAMAVNEQISYERATTRYERDRAAGKPARYVSKDWHDRSFSGMADSVRRLEYSASVDRVSVYDRLGNVVHEQAPMKGKVVSAPYLEAFRNQLTDFERIDLAQSWDEVLTSMEGRRASGRELEEARLASERAHYTLNASPAAAANYQHNNPAEAHESRDQAARYGEKLQTAFKGLDLAAARTMPELQGAFAAQAAAAKFVREHPNVPAEQFEDDMRDKIGAALRHGKELRQLQVRENLPVQELASPELDF